MGLGLVVLLAVLTVVVVVPVVTLRVVVRARGAVGGLVGWSVGVQLGLVRGFGGPFGVPSLVFWGVMVVLGVLWFRLMVDVGGRAWRVAVFESRVWLAARRNIEGF